MNTTSLNSFNMNTATLNSFNMNTTSLNSFNMNTATLTSFNMNTTTLNSFNMNTANHFFSHVGLILSFILPIFVFANIFSEIKTIKYVIHYFN